MPERIFSIWYEAYFPELTKVLKDASPQYPFLNFSGGPVDLGRHDSSAGAQIWSLVQKLSVPYATCCEAKNKFFLLQNTHFWQQCGKIGLLILLMGVQITVISHLQTQTLIKILKMYISCESWIPHMRVDYKEIIKQMC